MTYKTILTSKGTTTIPKEIREQLGFKPGMYVSFTKDQKTGEFVLKRAQTIDEVRANNKNALKQAKTSNKQYHNGDGYSMLVAQKFGK